jgi:hypothetical protein
MWSFRVEESKRRAYILTPHFHVAYLSLPEHPGRGKATVKKNVRLRDVIEDYTGPDLFLDFDENNVLLGVEVVD